MTYRFDPVGELPTPMEFNFAAGKLTVTEWPTVTPEPGRLLWESYGVCSHHFNNEAYGDVDAWTQRVADLGVYAFRSLASAKLDQVKRTLVRCKTLGLKWLATVANEQTTEKELLANLALVAANPDVFIGVEGINEPDGDGLAAAEIEKTIRFQRIIWDYVTSRPQLAHIVVLSPALRRPARPELYQRFVDAGMVGVPRPFHAVSLHHYLHGPPDVAELAEHIDMVQGKWRCDRFWITETGGTTAVNSTDPRRNTEAALAAYSLPTLFEWLSDPRVEKVFRYELLDDDEPLTVNEAYFGLWRSDGTAKPEVAQVRWLTHYSWDDVIFEGPEADLEIVGPPEVSYRVTQTSGHPPVVWLWRPGAQHDAEPVEARILTPDGEQTAAVGGAATGVPLEV
jgi:hypothetical protein